ncbi:hypothetical protein N2152v2_001119 [Parachlorella kessleri]
MDHSEELQGRPDLQPVVEHLVRLQLVSSCQNLSNGPASGSEALVDGPKQQQAPLVTAAAKGRKRPRDGESNTAHTASSEAGPLSEPLLTAGAGAEARPSGDATAASCPAPCPLCFGLLPALALPRHFPGSSSLCTAAEASGVALQVVLPPPAWQDPPLRYLAPQSEAGAAAGSYGATASDAAAVGAEAGVACLDGSSSAAASVAGPTLEQHQGSREELGGELGPGEAAAAAAALALGSLSAPIPCSSLREAAQVLAAEFDFGSSSGQAGICLGGTGVPPDVACAAAAGRSEAHATGESEAAACGGFALELSLPASLAVRAQALWWRLQSRLGSEVLSAAGIKGRRSIIDVKEAMKLVASAALSRALDQPYSPETALRVSCRVSHPASAQEASWLAPPQQQQQRNKRGRGRRGGRGDWDGRGGRDSSARAQELANSCTELAYSDALVRRLEEMSQDDFLQRTPGSAAELLPLPALTGAGASGTAVAGACGQAGHAPASGRAAGAAADSLSPVVTMSCQRRPIYVGGRYFKLRRGIPQSPWFINGARKGETSVEEEIRNVVLPRLRPDGCSFISAGREDYDVRMLGAGRPFVLEFRNARGPAPNPEACQEMERAINEAGTGVAVRQLSVLSSAQVAQLKEGESDKEKSYAAVCWLPRALGDADVAAIDATKELVIQQRTPIRVLHRRANLTRPRTVHSLRAERLPGQQQYFVLHLRTQAGTYVKEFVHGDLGRTQPSLGDLLGGVQAQIAYLDVTDIHMDFQLVQGGGVH